jgi:hypothetical protein
MSEQTKRTSKRVQGIAASPPPPAELSKKTRDTKKKDRQAPAQNPAEEQRTAEPQGESAEADGSLPQTGASPTQTNPRRKCGYNQREADQTRSRREAGDATTHTGRDSGFVDRSQLENSTQEPKQTTSTQQARANREPTIEEDNSSTQGSTQSLTWDTYDLRRQAQTRPQDARSSQPTDDEEDGAADEAGEPEGTYSRREETDPPAEDDDGVLEQEELFSPVKSNRNPTEDEEDLFTPDDSFPPVRSNRNPAEDEEDLFTPVRLWNIRSNQLSPERTETNISYNHLTEITSESETENEDHTAGLPSSSNSATPPNTTTTQPGPTQLTTTQPIRPTTPSTRTNWSQTPPQHHRTAIRHPPKADKRRTWQPGC